MKKKILGFMLVALVTTLVACNGKGRSEPTDDSRAESTTIEITAEGNTEVENIATENEEVEESGQESSEEIETVKLYDWDALMDLPDPIPAEENPEERMAHNIYAEPDLSRTTGHFTGFLIDFCTDCKANCTYWALCNWRMDTHELEKQHVLKSTGGAYAGLQNTADGKKAIMSFWEITYDENGKEVKVLASRVYPKTNKTSTFGGEGEGTNYISLFPWQKNHWYRMYLNCYDNEEGDTFVEQWFQDLESKEWTKISCFNTGLKHSCFMGGMTQFMENFWGLYSNEVRTFAYRNAYVREKETGKWKSLTKFQMSADTWWDNKKGKVAFTADENTLYGITCGYGPDSLKLNSDVSGVFEITQTEDPQIPDDAE